jgi:DNA-binding MltR family transcriptional regulator
LDHRLGRVVSHCFPVDGTTKKELFGSNGTLSSLDIKAKLAYTLGLVSKMAYQDICSVLTIRNKFAHRMDVQDFDHIEVSKLCLGLKLVEKHIFPVGSADITPETLSPKFFIEDLDDMLKDARQRYQHTIMLLTTTLAHMPSVRKSSTARHISI